MSELTKADEYRRAVSAELSSAMRRLHNATRDWEALKEGAKEAKASVEVAQQRVNRLADELRDIELGQYQPALVECANGQPAPIPDPNPLEALTAYGVTAKQVEMLQQSELELKTVEGLERAISEDEWWHKKVKGMGQTKIDGLIDALVKFREANPIAEPEADEPETPAE